MLFVRAPEESHLEHRICTFDSIRYYALEKLEAEGDVSEAEQRHAHYFLNWLQDQNALHLAGNLSMALELARQEVDNLQIAFERLVVEHPDKALVLSEELYSLILYEGWFDMGLAMAERLDAEFSRLDKAHQSRAYALRSRYLR